MSGFGLVLEHLQTLMPQGIHQIAYKEGDRVFVHKTQLVSDFFFFISPSPIFIVAQELLPTAFRHGLPKLCLLHLCICRLHHQYDSAPLAFGSMECWDVLVYAMGWSRVLDVLRQFHRLERECYKLGTCLV